MTVHNKVSDFIVHGHSDKSDLKVSALQASVIQTLEAELQLRGGIKGNSKIFF